MFGQTIEERVEAANAAIDGLLGVDPASLDQESLREWVVAMHRLQHRVEAVATNSTDAFDRHGDPEGATTIAAWIATRCTMKRSRAKAEVSRARALRRMPEVDAAYSAGAVTGDHVRVLGTAQAANAELFEKVEAMLVETATDQTFERFEREVAYFRQIADPDGTEQRAQDAFERRRVHASKTFEETTELSGRLDPMGGAVFRNELDRREHELFLADWAEARARMGDAARATDLQRTSQQRRADALVQMAIRSAAMPADAKQARALFTVLIGYETFHGMMCQLADGTVMAPSQLVPWLADVDVERVVFDGPNRVMDVGPKQRLFTGATRRAVEVRDLFCTHPMCDVPYERCDIDHVQRWEHGGPTIQSNGRVRCPHHNAGRRRPYQPPPPDDD
jgi:hypothetical protein